MIKTFVDYGAKVNVFNKFGVGLLGMLRHVDSVRELLVDICPELKPYADDFDFHQYIISSFKKLKDAVPPDGYEDYFNTCFMYGFIDFSFEKKTAKYPKAVGRLSILLSDRCAYGVA